MWNSNQCLFKNFVYLNVRKTSVELNRMATARKINLKIAFISKLYFYWNSSTLQELFNFIFFCLFFLITRIEVNVNTAKVTLSKTTNVLYLIWQVQTLRLLFLNYSQTLKLLFLNYSQTLKLLFLNYSQTIKLLFLKYSQIRFWKLIQHLSNFSYFWGIFIWREKKLTVEGFYSQEIYTIQSLKRYFHCFIVNYS